MSAKLIGALLIFAAGALLFLQCRRQSRGELLFLQDMASAMEQMEAAIRFRRLPMPDLLAEQTKRAYCGQVFTQVEQHMKSGSTLQDSWELAADAVPWQHWNYRAMHSGSGTICVLPLYLCGISSVSGRPDGMSGKK